MNGTSGKGREGKGGSDKPQETGRTLLVFDIQEQKQSTMTETINNE